MNILSQTRDHDVRANSRRTGGPSPSGALSLPGRVGKSGLSRVAHNHDIAGSNPAPATSFVFAQASGPP